MDRTNQLCFACSPARLSQPGLDNRFTRYHLYIMARALQLAWAPPECRRSQWLSPALGCAGAPVRWVWPVLHRPGEAPSCNSSPAFAAGCYSWILALQLLTCGRTTPEPCPIGGCDEPRRESFEPGAAPRSELPGCSQPFHSKTPPSIPWTPVWTLPKTQNLRRQNEERREPRRSPASRAGARSLRTCGPGSLWRGAVRAPRDSGLKKLAASSFSAILQYYE